jgi:hypothetical protein
MRQIQRQLFCALVGLAAAGPAAAQCVQNFSMASCTSIDVVVDALNVVSVVDPCTSYADSAQVILDAVIHNVTSPAAGRQDIGLFVALDGGSALTGGNCLHDYLEPPLTTSPVYGDANGDSVSDIHNGDWLDAEPFAMPQDHCGDIAPGTEAIKSLLDEVTPISISCVDTNGNGKVDVSVCVSWSNGTNNQCSQLSDARPASNFTCGCQRIDILPEPGPALALASGAALLAALGRGRIREE